MKSIIFESVRTQDAHGFVADIREFCDDLVVFDLDGNIRMARSEEGKLRVGDSISKHMPTSEWGFLRKNCISFACARALVDTRLGVMMVFCNMLASMHIMVGVIFKTDRSAVTHFFRGRVTMVDMISPRIAELSQRSSKVDQAQLSMVEEIAVMAFAAFATAGIKEELDRSLSDATAYIIRRICLLARMIGCRVNCRSMREFLPHTHDFNGNAFVAVMTHLLFFVYEKCSSRVAELEVGDFDGRPRMILRCELPDGEREVFVNRRYRYPELAYCDVIASEWMFLFECAPYAEGENARLRIAFCPKIKPVDRLQVKEKLKKLDYSDGTSR